MRVQIPPGAQEKQIKDKDMKKKKTKKTITPKQVKRPAAKKPKPRKYVEAKIPTSTVPSEQLDVPQLKIDVKVEAPDLSPSEVAEVLGAVDVFAESPPVPGVVRRHPYKDEKTGRDEWVKAETGQYIREPITDSTYIRMLKEEEEASREETERARQAEQDYYRELSKRNKVKVGWFARLIGWLNR